MTAPPSPATIPARTWGSAMCAVSAMRITSHSSAMDAPSPTAGPFTAQTTGTSMSRRSVTMRRASDCERVEAARVAQLLEPGEVASGARTPASTR